MNWTEVDSLYKRGALVDWCGAQMEKKGCKILHPPWVEGIPGQWVTMIEGVIGYVSCSSLTPHKAEGEK